MKKILAFTSVILLSYSNFVIAKEKNNVGVSVKEQYSVAEKKIKMWSTRKDLNELLEICDSIRFLSDKDGKLSLQQNKMALIFNTLNLIDKYHNKNHETPYVNIAPPPETGLPSGVAPSAIKDVKLREKYEQAIKKNNEIAETVRFQVTLGRIRNNWLEYMANYILKNCTVKQINDLIDNKTSNGASRTELKIQIQELLTSVR